MSRVRGGKLFIRIAILFLLACLAILFLAATIMSRKYSEGSDDSTVHPLYSSIRLSS